MSKSSQKQTKTRRQQQSGVPARDLDRLYKAHQIHTLAQLAWAGLTHGRTPAGQAWTGPAATASAPHFGTGGAPSSGLVYWYP